MINILSSSSLIFHSLILSVKYFLYLSSSTSSCKSHIQIMLEAEIEYDYLNFGYAMVVNGKVWPKIKI